MADLENYFYFHISVYVAMMNRMYSNISFKNGQQVCINSSAIQ